MKQTAKLIYQTALMESGFILENPKDFASRIYDSVKASLDISPDATVEEEEVEVEEEEPAAKESDSSSASKEEDEVDKEEDKVEEESPLKDEL